MSDRSAPKAKAARTAEQTLAGVNKVAALLLSMDKRLAARLLKHFDENEIKLIAQTATDLGAVSKPVIDGLIEEFAAAIKHGSDLIANSEQVENLLDGVVPPEQVQKIMAQVRNKALQSIWARLVEVPENTVARYLSKEHPQVTALVLSRATAPYAAATLRLLPSDLRKEVVRRMLALKPVLDRPLKDLEASFINEVLFGGSRNATNMIYNQIAGILNKFDRKQMDETFGALNAYNPKEAERVRELLFTFEDLSALSTAGLSILIDKVPPELISTALYGANPDLSNHILSAVPSRMKRIIEQELESGMRKLTKEVNKARRTIADLALQLIEQGAIEINSEEDEVE